MAGRPGQGAGSGAGEGHARDHHGDAAGAIGQPLEVGAHRCDVEQQALEGVTRADYTARGAVQGAASTCPDDLQV